MINELLAALTSAGTGYTTIAHAWDLEPVEEVESITPAIFLYLGKTKGLDRDGDSCVETAESRSVVVITVCKYADLETLRNQAKAVIRGYQVNQNQTPLLLAEGETVKIKGEYIWWQDIYITTDYS